MAILLQALRQLSLRPVSPLSRAERAWCWFYVVTDCLLLGTDVMQILLGAAHFDIASVVLWVCLGLNLLFLSAHYRAYPS